MAQEENKNQDEIVNVISTEQSQIDKSNPVEEKTIQNVDTVRETYIPTSEVCDTNNMTAPVSLLYEMNKNLKDIDRKVRGIDHFVMTKLGYKDMIELCRAFNAEQVDAIAAAIVQIEEGKAMIIGDVGGFGKGRILAGIARYARKIGKKPIFITERPNLYSDFYRDCINIGLDAGIPLRYRSGEVEKTIEVSRELVIQAMKEDIESDDFELEGFDPELLFKRGSKNITDEAIDKYRQENFPDQVIKIYKYETNKNYAEDIKGKKRFVPYIINGSSSKTEIKDTDGNILYKGLPAPKNYEVLDSKTIGNEYDCILATYSQFSSMKASKKIEFITAMAKDNIMICDESHNASGSSRRGSILQNIVDVTKGIVFSSATYAKRADNMPIYARKSNIADSELNSEELVTAIEKGGVAMQEIISSQLVAEGQMMRRERSYEGIEINYMTLDETAEVKDPDFNLKNAHYSIADRFLAVIRQIIKFVQQDVNPVIDVKRKDWIESECGKAVANDILYGDKEKREAARLLCKADLYNNSPYQGIFNIVDQLLFSINAEAVANWAIYRLHQGKKPVIALAGTLESVLDYAIEEGTGVKIDVDFSIVLKRRLASALTYTTLDSNEIPEKRTLDLDELTGSGQLHYQEIVDAIENLMTGITISPIDLIKKRIAEAGFTVEEVTGRNRIVEFDRTEESGHVKNRIIPNATDVFRNFNENIIDCLIINQAGSTGASAHAAKTNKVNKVNYENNLPVVPTDIEMRDYVMQRCMIILQAERDINKEAQKRWRVNRTGEIFKPIYDYIISAIPAQKRFMMMMRRKFRSLDANTSSNQKQSNEILDVVDFLNQYGDDVVAKYLGANPYLNSIIGNPVSFTENIDSEGKKELVPIGSIKDLAYNVTGRVAILSTEDQEKFYNEVVEQYKSYQNKLTQEGRWNLEVDSLDLQAKTLEKDAISVGNPKKKSVFGGATFLELCEINNIRKPFTKAYLKNLYSGILSQKDSKGMIHDISVDEYITRLHESIDARAKNEYNYFHPMYLKSKDREIEALPKDKRIAKIKNEQKRTEALRQETENIREYWDDRISSLSNIFERAKTYKEIVSFFVPKQIISYRLQNKDFDGLCVGVRMDDREYLSPYAFSLKIAFPSTLRYMDLNFGEIESIKSIMDSTLKVYDANQREVVGKRLYSDWDERTKDSASERVKRYIVTGNILKAYGIPELSNNQNRLISYSTIDKKVRKGILLAENFEVKSLYVKVPLDSAKNILVKSMGGNQSMTFGDDGIVVIVPRANKLLIRRYKTKKKSLHIDKNEELNQHLETHWTQDGDFYEAEISGKTNIENVADVLYSLGLPMNLHFQDFREISKNYDIQDRFKGEDAIEEMLKKYNEALEAYEKEQDKPFKEVPESVYKKMEDMEKELYDLRKEKENNKGLRFLVDTLNFAKKYKEKETAGYELGGEITIADAQEDEGLSLVSNDLEIREILSHFDQKFLDIDELTGEPYSNSIGGLFVKYENGDMTKVFAFEGNTPALDKPVFEIYPINNYFKK